MVTQVTCCLQWSYTANRRKSLVLDVLDDNVYTPPRLRSYPLEKKDLADWTTRLL